MALGAIRGGLRQGMMGCAGSYLEWWEWERHESRVMCLVDGEPFTETGSQKEESLGSPVE